MVIRDGGMGRKALDPRGRRYDNLRDRLRCAVGSEVGSQGRADFTLVLTDINGIIQSQQRYLPFGQVRTDTPPLPNSPIIQTDFSFTGQRGIAGLGLQDYNARFYDDLIGRWTQPDTVIPSYANPQGLNRYSYANNSPVRYNDPTGHFFGIDDAIVVGIVVLAAIAVVATVATEYNTPQMVQARDQIAAGWANNLDRWQQRNSQQWQYDYLDSQTGQTADGGSIRPGSGKSVCKTNPVACITVGVALLVGIPLAIYCSADGETCSSNSNRNPAKVLPTPAPASTNIPSGTGCPPPYRQCSTKLSSNSANKPTQSPMSTPKSPMITPLPFNRRISTPI